MVYDRNEQGGRYGRSAGDYGRDYGSGRDYTSSSARDYQAAGEYDRDDERGRDRDDDRGGWGGRESYGQRDYGRGGYGGGRQQYGQSQGGYGRQSGGGYGRQDYGAPFREGRDSGRQGYGRQPQGYDYDERGFFQRAGDEVRSWFGDDDAERRRDMDARYDEREYGNRQYGDRHQQHRDHDYHSWRQGQMDALDRDYDEYRREHRSKFENEFATWRTGRQGQRDLLGKVDEHMEVIGSDGSHVGTVDKVRGDRIILTKNDQDAGGRHHSIPSSWLGTVDTRVTLTKSADEAKKHWRDEERQGEGRGGRDARGRMLDRSFSGTY